MSEPEICRPSRLSCLDSSQEITSGLAFKRFKSAVAHVRIVQGICSTTSASDKCGFYCGKMSFLFSGLDAIRTVGMSLSFCRFIGIE